MHRSLAFIAVTVATVAVASPSASGRANATVDVADDVFEPAELTIKEDKTVDFIWVGVNDHDVYQQSGSRLLRGFGSWGPFYSYRFRKPGKYVLACTLHPDMLMDLKVKRRRR